MDAKEQIERINTLSAIARTSWLAMLGYFGFVGVTLLSVRDADFFLPGRETKLPLVDVAIPTFSFFIFAPILGAALYVYLHLHLLKLWDAIAAAWPKVEGEPLGERLHPWIANDFALARKHKDALRPRPLRWIGHFATWLLVWVLGPLVLAGFWLRSMPAHVELLTLALGAALLVSLYVGWVSWRAVCDWMPHRSTRTSPWTRWWRAAIATIIMLTVPIFGWIRTEGGLDRYVYYTIDVIEYVTGMEFFEDIAYLNGERLLAADPQREWIESQMWDLGATNYLAPLSFVGVSFLPADQSYVGCSTHKKSFRKKFAEREGIEYGEIWEFEKEMIFNTEWLEERGNYISNIGRIDLSGEDLRFADFYEARAVGLYLPDLPWLGARYNVDIFDGSNYYINSDCKIDWKFADLSDSDLSRSRLEGANLSGARLERANLRQATLSLAYLWKAQLMGADLREARLEGADLREARMEGANLKWARLERADLTGAQLNGVDLGFSQLEGADFRFGDFQRSNWEGASTWGSPAHYADFRTVHPFNQAQLEGLIGNADTLLPDRLNERGESYYVWSCWETPPKGFDALVQRWASNGADARAAFLCGPHERIKTGKPWPVDAPRPEGHPLGP